MTRVIYAVLFCLWALTGHAWNHQGHRVIAQIAYDNLTPKAKKMCALYLNSRSQKTFNKQFIAAAVWMDLIKLKNIHWYDAFHYIDIPFSTDNSVLPTIEKGNAVWGINNAISILSSKNAKKSDKRLALLILIHLVGDIHQPLHAVTKVSTQLPQGDQGGNLFLLGSNDVAENLHRYWDNGGGFFAGKNSLSRIKNKANRLEERFPCELLETQKNPQQWADMSHELAVTQVYQIHVKEVPSKQYQENAQNIAQKQVVLAGCRLSSLLNNIANK